MKKRTFKMWEHNGWGNSINWREWESRTLYGHLTPVPSIGDILECKMESGKVASFKFIKVNQMTDPKDQFFAAVEDLGYI